MVTDDAELIEGLTRGDERAFRDLVERYKKMIYFLALDMAGNPADAEDISQEVFIKVHRSFGTFKKDAKLGSWLYRITYNACIDHLRKRETTPTAVGDEVLDLKTREDAALMSSARLTDPARAAESEILQDRIVRALDKVSPQEKAVFLLRHYDDLLLKDIADVLGLSIGSVKSYLFRAVKKLQKELGGPAAGLEASHD